MPPDTACSRRRVLNSAADADGVSRTGNPDRIDGDARCSTTNSNWVVKSYVDATLWPEFLQLQTVLHEHFEAVTKRVIAQASGTEDDEVELREGQALEV